MTDMQGKTALITGGAGEIGVATARVLAARGARTVVADREGADWSALDAAVPDAVKLHGDVTREADWQGMVADCIEAAGAPTMFFNNAGVEGKVASIHETSAEDFEKVMAVNVRGVFLGLKHVIPIMVGAAGGSIVNASSVAGLEAGAGLAPYTTSKHAVIGLTRTAAAEYAAQGIRVNSVHPGPIDSRMMSSLEGGLGPDFERSQMTAQIPMGRYGRPEEVAELTAFLLSDAASYCNGGRYTADGGMTQS
ncbi:SDR family oxidoreductase [Pacificimonas sp. WHA3]|uniref:SDR family oxidoreductase n=1 Tax=Pacificimonas pallii TaxID=2827236 RepID=A0ABS6SBX1_9SPHN|nr:SDR family NAD(P)-dependent oxidoreductase [Pacificimonas pallii]MBV7255922.1 SDR family oxidoreductase [Pacificimonas pallii]